MYKVFINNKSINFVNYFHRNNLTHKDLLYKYISKEKLLNEIVHFELNDKKDNIFIYGDQGPEYIFKKLSSLYHKIDAAGGLVINKNGEILFIFRLDKWDLPKGKIEVNEGIEEAAIREVEEETSLTGLRVIRELTPTYHTYILKGKRILKKTYWFEMYYRNNQTPQPQYSEGIELVQWIKKPDINTHLENSYCSISELIRDFTSLKQN